MSSREGDAPFLIGMACGIVAGALLSSGLTSAVSTWHPPSGTRYSVYHLPDSDAGPYIVLYGEPATWTGGGPQASVQGRGSGSTLRGAFEEAMAEYMEASGR